MTFNRRFYTRRIGGRLNKPASSAVVASLAAPDAIFGAKLEAWWDFDSAYVSQSGGKVTHVEDRAGNNWTISQSSDAIRPVFSASAGANGHDAALFDAASATRLHREGFTISEGDRPSFFAVVKVVDEDADGRIFDLTEGPPNHGGGFSFFHDNLENQFSCLYRRQGEAFSTVHTLDFGTMNANHNLIEMHFSSSGNKAVLNGSGTLDGTTVAFGTRNDGDADTFMLGATTQGTAPLSMTASMVIILNDEPTDDELSRFRDWVASTYGITMA